jgi:hypothetical protein
MNPLKLRVKIGVHEFEAEGSEETVKAQLDRFFEAITSGDEGESPDAKNQWTIFSFQDLERAFERGPNWTVKLKERPKTAKPTFDAIVLLTYGIQAFHNLLEPREIEKGFLKGTPRPHAATASQLIESAKLSGMNIDRLDRFVRGPENRRNYIMWGGGDKRGITYTLTQPGRERAVDLINFMLEELENRA